MKKKINNKKSENGLNFINKIIRNNSFEKFNFSIIIIYKNIIRL